MCLLMTRALTDTYSDCNGERGNAELYISIQITCHRVSGEKCYMSQIEEPRVEVGKVRRLTAIQ